MGPIGELIRDGGHGEREEGMGQQRVHRSLSVEHKVGISSKSQ